MTATDDPGKTTRDDFVVAVSDYGQHALWRADSALPDGWRRQSAAMSRRACLDAIEAYFARTRTMPSAENLRVALGLSSKSGVLRLLRQLEESDESRRDPRVPGLHG